MKRRIVCAVAIAMLVLCACRKAAPETPAAYQPLSQFPPLGEPKPVEPGVVVHEVALPHGEHADRIWIYLPAKRAAHPLACVFIGPAGVPPFIGNGFGPDLDQQRHPEHLPYVHAGFAVVAFDTDGQLANPEDVTYEQARDAARAFRDADAGVLNARHAIDYVVKMVPSIDPARLYSAGHSSAGRIALVLAASEPRIAAVAAYAPVTDPEHRAEIIAADVTKFLDANLDGFRPFLRRTSPVQQLANLRCPVFLYHSTGDTIIPVSDTEQFAASLQRTNARVTFVRGGEGDHYDSMIDEAVPQAIAWMKELDRSR